MTWAGTKISLARFMAGATGLEPATFGVTGHKISSRNQYRLQVLRCKNRPKRRGKLERERLGRFGSGSMTSRLRE
jgi:hypothetical protein